MTFVVTVKADTAGAQAPAEKLVATLEDAEKAGQRAGDAISRGARASSSSLEASRRATAQARDEMGRFTRDTTSSLERAKAAAGDLRGELHAIAAALGIAHGVGEIVHLADAYTGLSNRLRAVAEDQENLNGLLEATFKVAQDTRTEWDEVALTYQKIAAATEHLGVSQQQVIDLTREIGQGLTLSGANAQEARMTMMELTHAFELGALTGREFRVILKDATPIVGELAKALGYSRSQFVEMGKHGKITAQMLIDGFAKAAPSIQEKFDKMVPTIQQSFIILENAAKKFFGEAGTGSGVMKTLGEAIRFVADHMDTFGRVLLGVGEAVVGLYVIEKVITMVRLLTVALAENPLTAILVVITVGISLLRQFGDEWGTATRAIVDGKEQIVTVGDYLRALWQSIKDLGAAILDFVETAWAQLSSAFSDGLDGSGIELSLRSVLTFMASFVDAAIALFKALKSSIVPLFAGMTAAIGALFVDLGRGVVYIVQEMINGVIRAYNAVRGKLFDIVNKVPERQLAAVREARAGDRAQAQGDVLAATREAEQKFPYAPLSSPKYVAGGEPAVTEARRRYIEERLADFNRIRQTAAYARRGLDENGEDPNSGKIGLLNLDFKNPLHETMDHYRQELIDAWGKDFGSTVATDFINGWLDRLDHDAKASAAERIKDQATARAVKTVGGPKGPELSDENAKLKREIEAIERASNPITEAEHKLAKAVDVTSRAVEAGLIPWQKQLEIIFDTAEKTRDARLPLEAWLREMRAESDALAMTNGEREQANRLREVENDLRSKGLDITNEVSAQIALEIEHQRSLAALAKSREEQQRELQSLLERIKGPTDEYNRGLANTRQLLDDSAITSREYELEIRRLEEAYLSSNDAGKTFEGGLRRGVLSLRDEIEDVGSQIETTLRNAFHGAEEALISFVTTGQAGFGKLVQSMLADLSRLILRQLEAAALSAAIGGGGAGGGGALANLSSGLQAIGLGALPGFAHGGSFTVSGQPGIDGNVVAMRISNGERVDITPQGQAAQAQSAPPKITIVNVYDRSEMRAFMETEGPTFIRNDMRRNDPATRGRTTGR